MIKNMQLAKFAEIYIHTRVIAAGVVFAFFSLGAYAADINEEIEYKEQVVQRLKEEIAQIDSEMARCERAKKNWKTATIVGGVGVAATGAAAIIQTVNANKKSQTEKK